MQMGKIPTVPKTLSSPRLSLNDVEVPIDILTQARGGVEKDRAPHMRGCVSPAARLWVERDILPNIALTEMTPERRSQLVMKLNDNARKKIVRACRGLEDRGNPG